MARKTPHRRIKLTGSWDLVLPSVKLIRTNFDTLTVLVLLPTLTVQLGSLLLGDAEHISARIITGGAVLAAGLLWSFLNYPAAYAFQLLAAAGEHPSLAACYRTGFKHFWRVIAASAVVGLLVLVGFLLFIVPGAIMLRRYLLVNFFLIDRGLGVREAMEESARHSTPVAGYIWGVIGVALAFNVAGSLVGASVAPIRGLDIIVSLIVSYLYYFGPVLRYQEVRQVHA